MTQEVFTSLATRVPAAGCAIAAIQREVARDQQRLRRRLAKMLDGLKLRPLAILRDRPSPITLAFWRNWNAAIVSEVSGRQHSFVYAFDRVPAVFMPNRLHRVRIAAKKLRYALEIADAAGLPVNADALRQLRKTQEVLGRLHDVHLARRLLDRVDGTMASEVRILDAVMAADCVSLHDKYLSRRQRLRSICQNGAEPAGAAPTTVVRTAMRALPAAGVVALPVAAWWLAVSAERPLS